MLSEQQATNRHTRRVSVYRPVLLTGCATCRTMSCRWQRTHVSATERAESMRLARKHVREVGHIVDFEDSYQTTLEPTEGTP